MDYLRESVLWLIGDATTVARAELTPRAWVAAAVSLRIDLLRAWRNFEEAMAADYEAHPRRIGPRKSG